MNDIKLSQDQVISIIADAINVPVGHVTANSTATDFGEWDSMGTLVLLTTLDRHGIKIDLGDTSQLQSVQGILNAFRKAGRLA